MKATPGNVTQIEEWLAKSDISDEDGIDTSAEPSAGPGGSIYQPVLCAVDFHVTDIGGNTEQIDVGVAFGDASFRKIGVLGLKDSSTFFNLESLLIQHGVKECLVVSNVLEDRNEVCIALGKKLKSVIKRCGISVSSINSQVDLKNENELNALIDMLGELCTKETAVSSHSIVDSVNSSISLKLAFTCLYNVIDYLNLQSFGESNHSFEYTSYDLSNCMRLDASAVAALHIFPNSSSQGSNRNNSSVFGLLNHCQTAAGSRLLSDWLKQPLLDEKEITKRHIIVQILTDHPELRQAFQEEHFKRVPDLSKISKRLQKSTKGSLQDLVRLYDLVSRLPFICETLRHYSDEFENDQAESDQMIRLLYLQPLIEANNNLSPLAEMVEKMIDLEAVKNHQYLIRPDFDEALINLKQQMIDVERQISRIVHEASIDLELEIDRKLKLERNNQYGYFMRCSRIDSRCLTGRKKYFELTIQKSGVFFTTAQLKQLSDDFTALEEQYQKQQTELVNQVREVAASYTPMLERLNQIFANLDVMISFAHVSTNSRRPYCRPKISADEKLLLAEARHPCLEMQSDINFISNNVRMIKGESEFQIITGPNMGGKSTFIRQIGMIAFLSQIGCFVPCSEAEIPIFDAILCRVGAGDNQMKGVSTFMAEMLESAAILRTATAKSLVIVDELGRGTSTSDGFGLAWAISEYLAGKVGCFCLFATHFHELTELSKSIKGVKNVHVTAAPSKDGIVLLYKVEDGMSDQSFGIHCAEMAHFPKNLINLAKRKVEELENGVTDDFTAIEALLKAGYSREEIDDGVDCIEKFISTCCSGENDEEIRVALNSFEESIKSNNWLSQQVFSDAAIKQ